MLGHEEVWQLSAERPTYQVERQHCLMQVHGAQPADGEQAGRGQHLAATSTPSNDGDWGPLGHEHHVLTVRAERTRTDEL